MTLDWLIIGGGPHGVHAAVVLRQNGVAAERLAIVDPHENLLDRWSTVTQRIGMKFLRSPIVHHVDYAHDSLWNFARERGVSVPETFLPPYQQPAYDLFQDHGRAVVERRGLAARHVCGRALAIRPRAHEVVVETTAGSLTAARVVLAPGAMEEPVWPAWAPPLRAAGARIFHIYDHVLPDLPPALGPVAVIGGGLSAVQYALAQAENGPKHTILSRHPLRVHQFDSDAGWMGPKFLDGFRAKTSPAERRETIRRARFRGSVPYQVEKRLRATPVDRVEYRVAQVTAAAVREEGGVRLELDDGRVLDAATVVLATGFATHCPGGALVSDLAENESLPRAPCGFPLPGATLAWHPRVIVTGPLAELELGPTARNLAGARAAGRLLEESL